MGKSTANRKKVSFAMLLITIGIVYGDIGTSPMYVMKSIMRATAASRRSRRSWSSARCRSLSGR